MFFTTLKQRLLTSSIITILSISAVHAQYHWETIIQANNSFKYLEAISEPPSDWTSAEFSDVLWSSGIGGIGYDDGDDQTVIEPVNSLYLRKEFNVSDVSNITDLILNIDYDDAFVAYLNGIEVARSFNVTENNPTFNSTLSVDREATGSFEYHNVSKDLLVNGLNILAIQIINMSITSSDLSSIVYLNAKVNTEAITYNQVPDWFAEPTVFTLESSLPIIVIETGGPEIPDDPRIIADMTVFNNGVNNSATDTEKEYEGKISIEKRGSSSQYFFPKISYALETQTDTGSNNNVSLLGLPKENDWILYAPYSDKTMMRNELAYHLANKTGRWSPNTRYCELIVNNEYLGVYLLTEKIKRDKDRLDIAKLNEDENAGDSLTGGYILKIDRGEDYWESILVNGERVNINYVYPEIDDITSQQKKYIKDYVTVFETVLNSSEFKNPELGYRKYINVESFIDFYLLNEFSKNVDAYILSTFFYKDKDSKGGKITMGPFWDYNLAYGNADYRSGNFADGWIEDAKEPAPFWFERLLEDPYYKSEMRKRWFSIREDWLNEAHIFNHMDSIASVLDKPQERNYERWPIIGEYIWPNGNVAHSYAGEIRYMKDWISDRLVWMDNEISEFEEIETVSSNNPIENNTQIKVYPNPFKDQFSLSLELSQTSLVRVEVYSTTGQLLDQREEKISSGRQFVQVDLSSLTDYRGMLIYKVAINDELAEVGHLIKL